MTQDFDLILNKFGAPNCPYIKQLGSGLINNTWLAETETGKQFILQKINLHVFRSPELIGNNIGMAYSFLKENYPDYVFPTPIPPLVGKDYVRDNSGAYYRLFEFIPNSHTEAVVSSPQLAFSASQAFGKLTRLLSPLNSNRMKITLNNFHNLTFRYEEFFWAFNRTTDERKAKAADSIRFLMENRSIALEYELIKKDPEFKLRITHHDTKISNILLGPGQEVLSIIDLDTLMPGYFISDLGDMMRTYISPVSEEEQNYEKIIIRPDYLDAVLEGYLSEMRDELSPTEKQYLHYSGRFIIYMQAMRFTTDYLNQDIYYETHYPDQNLHRAENQIALYKQYLEFKDNFNNHHRGQR